MVGNVLYQIPQLHIADFLAPHAPAVGRGGHFLTLKNPIRCVQVAKMVLHSIAFPLSIIRAAYLLGVTLPFRACRCTHFFTDRCSLNVIGTRRNGFIKVHGTPSQSQVQALLSRTLISLDLREDGAGVVNRPFLIDKTPQYRDERGTVGL